MRAFVVSICALCGPLVTAVRRAESSIESDAAAVSPISPESTMMSVPKKQEVFHFVAFTYKNPKKDSRRVRREFLKLKNTCRLKNGRPVIEEVTAGDQNSKEGVAQSYTDGFIVKYNSEAMRDYYVGCLDKPCQDGGTVPKKGFCKSHDDFKVFVGPLLKTNGIDRSIGFHPGVLVFDYTASRREVFHFVSFAYKNPKDSKRVRREFLKLKDTCRLKNGKRVIKEVTAGDQNSKEGVAQSYTDGFIVKYNSEAMRDYYVGCLDKPCQLGGTVPKKGFCESHDDFKVFVGPLLKTDDSDRNIGFNAGVFVFDYTGTKA